jgi:hypothetical protein
MYLQKIFAENYFVLIHANFTVPKIQNSECQAGFEAIHKTVYELRDLPVKGTHENSAHIHMWAWASFRTPSPRSGSENKQVSQKIPCTL